MFQVYSPSGRFSPTFIIYALIAAIAVVGIAFVYQLGLTWIPFVYINFLLTAAMGVAVGKATEFVIKRGHVRNVILSFLVFATLLVLGLGGKFGFQYLTERIRLREDLRQDELQEFLLEEFTFMEHIKSRVEDGWKVGRGGKAPLAGPFVYLVWLAELGIIGYVGGSMVIEAARKPYSEPLGLWASSETNEMVLPVTNESMVTKIKSAQSVQELLELPIPDTDQSNKIAVYQVFSVPDSPQADAFLTVDLQTHSRNDKGEIEIAHQYLVKLAVITAAQRAQLRENSELMQEALADYRASLSEEAKEPPAT